MWRADSLGKTLILGKIEGRRRRGWQRMRLLDSITDSMDRSSEGQGSLAFTRDWDRPAFERLSVSCGGTCQQWNLFQKDLYQYAITSQDFFSQYPWPRLGHCGLRPPPETTNTHRQVCLSLLWGHCSFLLDPGVLKALFVPSKTLFPQSCGSSIIKSYWPSKSNFPVGSLSLFQILRLWNLLVGPRTFVTQQELLWNNCPPVCGSPARRLYSGLMSTSSKRKSHNYTCQDRCYQGPLACNRPLLTRASAGDTQTLKGRSVSVSCGGHCSFPWIPVHTRFCLCPLSISGKYELWFKMWLHPSYHLAAASSLPLDVGYLFLVGSYILLTSTFSCRWLFSSQLRFLCSCWRRWAHLLLIHHLDKETIQEPIGWNQIV